MTSAAIRECRRSIAEHSKSFALASRLLPSSSRDHAAVVYAWCRRADDTVDDYHGSQQRRGLDKLRRELDTIYSGGSVAELVPAAFADVVKECGIPRTYPEELLAGMEMDVVDTHYESLDELLLYCYRVASTVGLMMCHVMGISEQAAIRPAAHLGIAMQLTNICRDVREDWDRGRIYLPHHVLAHAGLGELRNDLGTPLTSTHAPGLQVATASLLNSADRFYESADSGLTALSPRCAFAVRSARMIYSAIGDVVRRQQCNPLAARAFVNTPSKLLLVGRSAWMSAQELPLRVGAKSDWRSPLRVARFPDDVLPV